MHRIWIYAMAVLGGIVTACSDGITEAHEENPSGKIEIILVNKSSSSEASSSSFFRTNKTDIFFSNKIEIKIFKQFQARAKII